MNLNYSYCYPLVSFAVGALSGLQSIVEKYRTSRWKAVRNWAGLTYLAIRGLVSSAVFVALYFSSFYWSSAIYSRPLLWAIICGTGAEYFLRSKIFVFDRRNPTGRVETVMLGPLNLVLGFQTLFLDIVEEKMTPLAKKEKIERARRTIEFIRSNLPDVGFQEYSQIILRDLEGFEREFPDQVKAIRQRIEQLKVDHEQQSESNVNDEKFKYELGYSILNELGEEAFKTLSPQTVTDTSK
jgi:hypothetical protein